MVFGRRSSFLDIVMNSHKRKSNSIVDCGFADSVRDVRKLAPIVQSAPLERVISGACYEDDNSRVYGCTVTGF